MDYFCSQCGTWRDKESVTFPNLKEAEQHVLDFHPGRLLDVYQDLMLGDEDELLLRQENVIYMLRNRNVE